MTMIEKSDRLIALDAFRGLTIATMILVNTPGSWSNVYAPLLHASWHGFTPTDLVFPFFLFAVGAAMSFSLRKYEGRSSEAVKKILKRTALIFLIGIFLNIFPGYHFIRGEFVDFSTLRIMGVLQRIALAYGVGALICYFLDTRKVVIVSSLVLLGYWLVMGILGSGDPYSLEGNAALKLDLLIIGADHLYKGFGIPFDPEGLLSTLPAVVNVTIGFLAGSFVRAESNKEQLISRFFLFGNGLIFFALCWDMVFPINKPIWTSSYVLMSSGIALVILSFLVYVLDIKRQKSWARPLLVFGMNPLAIYVLSGVWVDLYFQIPAGEGQTAYGWIYENIFVPIGGKLNGSLLFALAHVTFYWFFGWLLYRKNIVIKI